jgi:hypothetical protein
VPSHEQNVPSLNMQLSGAAQADPVPGFDTGHGIGVQSQRPVEQTQSIAS